MVKYLYPGLISKGCGCLGSPRLLAIFFKFLRCLECAARNEAHCAKDGPGSVTPSTSLSGHPPPVAVGRGAREECGARIKCYLQVQDTCQSSLHSSTVCGAEPDSFQMDSPFLEVSLPLKPRKQPPGVRAEGVWQPPRYLVLLPSSLCAAQTPLCQVEARARPGQ